MYSLLTGFHLDACYLSLLKGINKSEYAHGFPRITDGCVQVCFDT